MKQGLKILGIIPARGGSKSVPGKNIRVLAGKPLIVWTIEEAKKSKHLNRLIVSTDDPGILEIARNHGVEAPFLRPKEISGDFATDVEFLTHTLDFLKKHEGYEPDIILRLPPTSPLRTAEHIDRGVEMLLKRDEADAVRPITESPKHPYKMWRINTETDFLEPFLPESFTKMKEPYNMPRQILPKAYVHTGAMDVMRLKTIRKLKSTSGKRLAYFFMKPEDSINIDSEIDFEVAEILMARRLKRGG